MRDLIDKLNYIESSCPRTKASDCTCESIKTISESEETIIAQCNLQHSDKVKVSQKCGFNNAHNQKWKKYNYKSKCNKYN